MLYSQLLSLSLSLLLASLFLSFLPQDDLNLGVLDELGDANEWLGCLDDDLPSQEILSSILDMPDNTIKQQQS